MLLCIMDDTVFVIHEIPPCEGIKDGVTLHAVVVGQIVVISQPFKDSGFVQHIFFALLERMDIALTLINISGFASLISHLQAVSWRRNVLNRGSGFF
jgi:hypothetical protein